MRPESRSSLTAAEMRTIPAAARDLAAELSATLRGDVRFDGWSRSLYSTDASLYQIQPIGVVIPRTVDDVQAAVTIAARRNVPILARGSGSSLSGQAVGAALVLDFSRHLDRILAIDAEARTATVQPGITVAALNRTLAPLGLMLGPDPASAERATIGGCVGNNATGSHSILYGMMADAVRAVEVILSDGSAARFAAVQTLEAQGHRPGLEGAIYRAVAAIAASAAPQIGARWPRHWRRTSGYTLDRIAAPLLSADVRTRLGLRAANGVNLAQLLVGSEGTLAVLTSVTLDLVERPARTAVAVVHFDDLIAACAAVPDILAVEPSACELLDRQLMNLARAQPEWARKLHFVEGDPAAVLLTEFYGGSEAELTARIDRLEAQLRRRGHGGALLRVLDARRQADLWAVRKAGLNLLMSRRGDFKPVPGIEDVSVPPQALAAYLGRVLAWCAARESVRDVAVYAHASAGCLHVRPAVNVKSAAGVATLQAMADFSADLCLEYGGALSGEHGDGLSRSALNARLFGPELYGALQAVKRAFDPATLLNPGKVVDAPPLTENLRMGAGYTTIPPATVFDWSADEGFAGAVEMCNGAGVCRKREAGVMCPSFMATREERDSTRGRANALRNALAGRIPPQELTSAGMADVLDLCLGCKACKSECPSSVDMARIKSEFLVHYYRANGLPLFNRLMGLLPALNRLLHRAAAVAPPVVPIVPIVNNMLRSRAFRQAQRAIGIAPQRTLPLYAARSFAQECAGRVSPLPQSAVQGAPRAILFHDTWCEHNEPHVARAALRVLEAAGWRVDLAWGRACCGRPLITGGQADRARAWADHNVALLAPYVAQGIPIVGVEPSCILTLRDEYPALASDRRRATLLAGGVYTFEEFVTLQAQAGRFAPRWREAPGAALLHGHCHTRALVGNEPALAALRLAGYSATLIDSGCCGMAGDFGYEAAHYAISCAIGEDRLLPAVRAAAAETLIVASGTSCRHQIADLTPRRALHLAEALALALAE